jgi:hypothetical protein
LYPSVPVRHRLKVDARTRPQHIQQAFGLENMHRNRAHAARHRASGFRAFGNGGRYAFLQQRFVGFHCAEKSGAGRIFGLREAARQCARNAGDMQVAPLDYRSAVEIARRHNHGVARQFARRTQLARE